MSLIGTLYCFLGVEGDTGRRLVNILTVACFTYCFCGVVVVAATVALLVGVSG